MGMVLNKARPIYLLVLVLLLSVYGPTQAGAIQTPLYLLFLHDMPAQPSPGAQNYFAGDLWKWVNTGKDGNLTQVTNWGFNSPGILSPDGKYLSYQSLHNLS